MLEVGNLVKILIIVAQNTPNLHFHDMSVAQKFLVERYGINDVPSSWSQRVIF